MIDVEIIPASPTDAEMISALSQRTYTEAFGAEFEPDELAHYLASSVSLAHWRQFLAVDRVLIARVDNAPVGFVQWGLTDDAAMIEIKRLYVLAAHQRRGIGVALLRAALDAPECTERPVRIDVWEHNHAARRLYERFGFHDEGERAPFLLKSGEIDGYDVVLVRRPAAT